MADFHIVLAGAGLGSVIAECALRLGFRRISIIDGDVVEKSNLNRQNYTWHDIGSPKAEALRNRLLSICPQAEITSHNQYITSENAAQFLKVADAAINAIDFTSDVPFVFDRECVLRGIPALHPYNLGWAGCVFVVTDESENLSHISTNPQGFELKCADFIIEKLAAQGENMRYLETMIQTYRNEPEKIPPPQLSVASWITAGLCTDILFRLATGKEIALFPGIYCKKV
jgi:molybdopterin/thiamine biosynthesis adenylyltransferase